MRSSQISPSPESPVSTSVTLCLQRRASGAYLPDPLKDDAFRGPYHLGTQQRPFALRGDELLEGVGRRPGLESELLDQPGRVDHPAVDEEVQLVQRDGPPAAHGQRRQAALGD